MNQHIIELMHASLASLSKNSYFNDIQRHIEKEIIQHILAPMKLAEVHLIITSYQQKIHQSALTTKQHVQALNDLVHTVVEGQWSKKIHDTIEQRKQLYDKI